MFLGGGAVTRWLICSIGLTVLNPLCGQSSKSPVDPKETKLDLRPESALDRLRRRNLFHPTRGVIDSADGAAQHAVAKLPQVLGTLVTPKYHSALLQWGEKTEALLVAEGEDVGGFHVMLITKNRVQLRDLATKEQSWVDLDPVTTSVSPGGGEIEALLSFSKERAVIPSVPKIQKKSGSNQ